MEIKLVVNVNGEYGSYSAGVDIPEQQQRMFKPMHVVDEAIGLYLDPLAVNEVRGMVIMQAREDAAKVIAENLTRLIVDAMKSKDTFNGYAEGEG